MNINEINSIVQDVVFLDIETSGLNPYTSEILEIGAIKIENNKLTSFHTFVRNKKEVPLEVFSLCTNLNQNDLDKAPNLYEIKKDGQLSGLSVFIIRIYALCRPDKASTPHPASACSYINSAVRMPVLYARSDASSASAGR